MNPYYMSDTSLNKSVLDMKIYNKAKKEADKIYKRHSAYKSMFIQKKYQELGGRYSGERKKGLDRWRKEEWIQVKPYLQSGKIIACGSIRRNKVCRPLKRVNKSTPITIGELLKIHSKQDLLKLANKKIKNMDGRVFWKTLKFIPSKK